MAVPRGHCRSFRHLDSNDAGHWQGSQIREIHPDVQTRGLGVSQCLVRLHVHPGGLPLLLRYSVQVIFIWEPA